jgi:hypothetical protein
MADMAGLQSLWMMRPTRPLSTSAPLGPAFAEQVAALGNRSRQVTTMASGQAGFAIALARAHMHHAVAGQAGLDLLGPRLAGRFEHVSSLAAHRAVETERTNFVGQGIDNK